MDNSTPEKPDAVQSSADYEAPAIEAVVTRNDMEREVHYAGINPVSR